MKVLSERARLGKRVWERYKEWPYASFSVGE